MKTLVRIFVSYTLLKMNINKCRYWYRYIHMRGLRCRIPAAKNSGHKYSRSIIFTRTDTDELITHYNIYTRRKEKRTLILRRKITFFLLFKANKTISIFSYPQVISKLFVEKLEIIVVLEYLIMVVLFYVTIMQCE